MHAELLPKSAQITNMRSELEDQSHEDETRGTKRKISLSDCAVCGAEEARYTCPRCLTHSCSLLCVKRHKEDTGCSGVRDKTAFVSLSQFDEMNLLNDYRFLEDTGRFSDGASRDALIRVPHVTMKAKCFMSNARKMNITLRLLPCTFTKSKENSTFFNSKEKRFMWHLKLLFPHSGAEFTQRRVSDQLSLLEILNPFIHPTESDPVTRHKLKMYVHEPLEHVKVFMKAEGRKANSVRYHELDLHKSLRDNLSYKTLIEYPVLHVVLKDHWKDYPLKGPAAEQSTDISNESVNQHREEQSNSSTKTSTAGTGASEISSPQAKRLKRDEEAEKEEGELSESSDENSDSSSSDESSDASEGRNDGPADAENMQMNASDGKSNEKVENCMKDVFKNKQNEGSQKSSPGQREVSNGQESEAPVVCAESDTKANRTENTCD